MEEVTAEGLLNKGHEYSGGRAEWECARQHKKKRTYREKQREDSEENQGRQTVLVQL